MPLKIADKISDIIDEHNKRYKTIILDFFKLRIEMLKEVLGTENRQVLKCLAGFTQKPIFSLLNDFPVYNDFCNWFDIKSNVKLLDFKYAFLVYL